MTVLLQYVFTGNNCHCVRMQGINQVGIYTPLPNYFGPHTHKITYLDLKFLAELVVHI